MDHSYINLWANYPLQIIIKVYKSYNTRSKMTYTMKIQKKIFHYYIYRLKIKLYLFN